MGRKRKTRRQAHGSAWHWKQTDCWYYTLPGTKQRIPLFDEQGQRIRGKDNRQAADLARARLRVAGDGEAALASGGNGEWLVARVCSNYLQYCKRGVETSTLSKGHLDSAVSFLNDLCGFCGALPVAQLKKEHIETWLANHATWRSPATRRSVIAIVLAAFNRAKEMSGIASPLKGLKKPASQPRLHSINPEDEKTLYGATEVCFRNFLFAAVHTGLRPFCELARLTADDVVEAEQGMMWRVYSSKTKKTRRIPVRPEVAELTRQLMKTAPKGSGTPLFRNTQGKRWKRMTGVVRFLTIKAKLGWDHDPAKTKYSSYSCRHTFAHRMLSGYWTGGAGCSIETLAELIGDTPKVAFDHYGREWGQHYQEPLWAAIGGGVKRGRRTAAIPTASGRAPVPHSQKARSRRIAAGKPTKRGAKSASRQERRNTTMTTSP